jgi:hypothetical protein
MAIRYIVNEKDRIVVAILNNCSRDAIHAANAWTGSNTWDCHNRIDVCVHYDNKYLIPDKFTGIAKCSTEDAWDENVGKQIARDRVLNKYHKSLNKAVRKINTDIARTASDFNVRVSKLRDTK